MGNTGVDFSQFQLSDDVHTFQNVFICEEIDRLVAEVVRYVLFKTNQSWGCPIKRDELTQIVTKNYRQRAFPGAVIDKAIQKLSGVFSL